jgi:hypothetical protein
MTPRIPESVSSWPAVANMIPPRDRSADDDENEDEAEHDEPAVSENPMNSRGAQLGPGQLRRRVTVATLGKDPGRRDLRSSRRISAPLRPVRPKLKERCDRQPRLAASDRMNGFLDLGNRVVSDLIQFDMRHVRHFVRGDYAVDDRGTIDRESLVQFGTQQAGVLNGKAVSATGPCQGREIRIGKFNRFAKWQDANALGFQCNEAQRRIVENDHLDRQLVMDRRHDDRHRLSLFEFLAGQRQRNSDR